MVSTAMLGMFCACSPSLKVVTDYDKKADFTNYKTFAIDTLRQSQAISQLNSGRLIDAVRSSLKAKGLTESTDPELLVHISAILKERTSVSSTSYGYGAYYRPYMWAGGGTNYTTYDVNHYNDGSLIIDLADAKTKHLLWEGIGNSEIDGKLKDPDTEIPKAVAEILKNYPPGSAAK